MPVPGNAEYLPKQVLSSQAVPEGKLLSLAHHPPAVFLRPVEALHLLSLVTAPAYSADDLHDAYAWWGLLRYLGFFDREAGTQARPMRCVSHAGAQVAGDQRRWPQRNWGSPPESFWRVCVSRTRKAPTNQKRQPTHLSLRSSSRRASRLAP
jgi:hypothetical protein